MSKRAQPIRETSLTDGAYLAIRQAVIRWELRPGQQVSELQLCNQYGLSRAAARAALLRLSHEGLMQAVPRRGYIIAPITFQQIKDTFGVRAIIEPAAAAMLANRVDGKSIDRLEEMNEACKYVSGPYDSGELRQANRDFHVEMVRMTGNLRLAQITSATLDDLQRMLYLPQLVEESDTVVSTWSEHRVILEAIRSKDPDAAAAAALAHVTHNRETLIHALLSSPSLRSINLGSSMPDVPVDFGR